MPYSIFQTHMRGHRRSVLYRAQLDANMSQRVKNRSVRPAYVTKLDGACATIAVTPHGLEKGCQFAPRGVLDQFFEG